MENMNGGCAVVRVFEQAGIDTIYTLHGGHIDPILEAADDAGMKILDTRHEAVTGYAADAHVRMTGKLAVSLTTAGPGFTNMLTAMASAWLDRIPVVFISGAPPLRDGECNVLQGGLDQVAIAAPMTKWSGRATSLNTAVQLTAHAIRTANSGTPGPVFLELPIDILYGPGEVDIDEIGSMSFEVVRPAPTPSAIEKTLEILSKAERPVIMAGTGAVLSQAGEELLAFAHRANIPVFYNVKAAGLVPGTDPLVCGTFADITRSELNPDAVLLLGARTGMYTGGATGVIPAEAKLIHVDLDARELGRLRAPQVGIVADCRETLQALLDCDTAFPQRDDFISNAQKSRAWVDDRYGNLIDTPAPIHQYQALSILKEFLDDSTLAIGDGGDTSGWNEITLADTASQPGVFASVGYLGNLGMHQGWAIAAQLAHPEKRIVCVTGDGSVGFQAMEFDTFARHDLPIVTVVLNNNAWGMSIVAQHFLWEGRDIASKLSAGTRYDLMAEACGGHGELVTEPGELKGALQRAFDSGKPACVNVIIGTDTTIMSPRTEAMLAGASPEETIVMPYYDNLEKK